MFTRATYKRGICYYGNVAGWVAVTAGIVSKRLNLRLVAAS